jgi:5,10-methylenetetrahydromethanopterin reductase
LEKIVVSANDSKRWLRGEKNIMPRIGLMIAPEAEFGVLANTAKLAEKYGFDSLWIADGAYERDFNVAMTVVSYATRSIGVAIGVTNPYTRHPVKTACAIASINELLNGRAILGVGAGSRDMLQSLGKDWVKPVKTCEEAIKVIRAIISGESVDFKGETVTTNRVRIQIPKKSDIPIIVGCRRPLMLQMAGRVADGILLDNAPINYMREAVEYVEKGASSANRKIRNFEFGDLVVSSISEDRREARDRVKRHIPYDFITISERELKTIGLTLKDAEPIRAALRRQLPEDFAKARGAVTDKMVDEFSVSGNPEDCIRQIEAMEKAGMTLVMLSLPSRPEDEPEEMIKLFGEHVIPYFKK